jgi:hypothetical protein
MWHKVAPDGRKTGKVLAQARGSSRLVIFVPNNPSCIDPRPQNRGVHNLGAVALRLPLIGPYGFAVTESGDYLRVKLDYYGIEWNLSLGNLCESSRRALNERRITPQNQSE